MEYHERIEAKVGILFQIADQYLSGQIPIEQAKEMISFEMVHIRPAQFEAMKAELAERLKDVGHQPKSEKLFKLFKNYISPPFNKLQNGHPLRNYYEENSCARSYLLRIDEMEEMEAALEDWTELYELLSGFGVHIKRQEKNFYPLLIPMDMRPQVEKAKEFGKEILEEIDKNKVRLKNGDIVDFLFYQRSLSQTFMSYLDLEERVLYPKALISFTDQDFETLRRSDDNEGYVFVEPPAEFTPTQTESAGKEAAKVRTDLELILPAVLAAKEMSLVYYTPSGEVVSVMGNQITESDLQISEETRRSLLNGSEKQKKSWYNQGNQTYLITCSTVTDSLGKCQGLLKIKENISEIKEKISEIKELAGEGLEGQNRGIDSTQNIAELFSMYPKFQEDFYHLDEELKGLKGPLGMDLLKDSTVGMIAKSLRMDAADLVDRINNLLKSY